ncbi:NAD(P)H-dependent oxidoreductase [Nocardia carnea]|uniref:NAD(P)H-dependent oxidoreductase n=1 Tax=Nocardia carnea TaxID=37328 RepID=UPI002456DC9E|nr:NAD(P)H-dependent oxidoreductase [Nocardia carnea]
MSQTRIVVLFGSLRSASFSKQVAEASVGTAPEGVDVSVYEGIGDIPFYNEDIDVPGSVPAAAEALRDAVGASDGLLLITPEYNGTLPAVLKNAVDWLSRPYGAGAIKEKPVAILSGSISPNAAKWAHADAVKTVGVAGGKIVDEAHLHFATWGERFGVNHPREDAETLRELGEALRALVNAASGELVDA